MGGGLCCRRGAVAGGDQAPLRHRAQQNPHKDETRDLLLQKSPHRQMTMLQQTRAGNAPSSSRTKQ
jgi:hypothetical protein